MWCLHLCVYRCIHPACVEAGGGRLVSCPITLHQNLSLRPGARLAVSKPQRFSCLCAHSTESTRVCVHSRIQLFTWVLLI